MVKLCNSLIEMKKKNDQILMTNKLFTTLRSLYEENKRTWRCQALRNFIVIDPLGKVAGCHSHNFVGSMFDLPRLWKSQEFKELRQTYNECNKCNYLCYMFYSLQGSPSGYLSLAMDQWKNAGLIFKKVEN